MSTYAIRHPEAAALHGFALLLRTGAHRVSYAAQKLDAWLEARRLAADARRDLSEMSDPSCATSASIAVSCKVVKGGSPRTVEERIAAVTFAASMRS